MSKFRVYLSARLFLSIIVISLCAHLAIAKGYNEISRGNKIYPHYEEHYANWLKLSEKEKREYLKESKKAFSGDNTLDPMPRVLDGREYDQVLKRGVEQRARALVAFLKDHYSGRRTYLSAGIVSESTIRSIIERTSDHTYDQLLKGEKISFVYGPDIIRDEKGQWRVIEDNPGFVGGIGDLVLAQKFYLKNFPHLSENFSYRDAEKFYDELARLYKKRAAAHGGDVVMYMTPPYPDNEDKRVRKLLSERGIRFISPYTTERLSVEKDGVYTLNTKTNKKTKVGLIILNGEHWWLDANYEANTLRLQKSTDGEDSYVAYYQRLGRDTRGLTEAILQKKVASNYTPGIDFIGDKEFYIYVEDFIRFYLGEEPIIKNISSKSFAHKQTGALREKLLKHVLAHIDQYVIKTVDGRGGDGVWVGPKLTENKIMAMAKLIRKSPHSFIVQKYTPLSTLNDLIVDLRILSLVSDDDVYVSDTPWGRGLPKKGDGKVNLSSNGREITVLVADKKKEKCQKLISNSNQQ
ncbi:MAG: circularly permuted type 2 ATP-grasp protein [Bdellovibrionales bacterium]|nr:circularly permuted type 2 ATP-grasp protein [Bdellovibrionales bacterium]